MNKKVKRIILIVLMLAAAAGVGYRLLKPAAVEGIEAVPREMKAWFQEDGKIRSAEDFQIFSQVSGEVLEVLVTDGDYVEAGTVIARADSEDYLREMRTRESTIASYQAQKALSIEGFSQDQYRIEMEYQQNLMEKNRSLFTEGVISEAEFDAAEQAYKQAKSRFDQAGKQKGSTAVNYAALIETEQELIANLQKLADQCTIITSKPGYIKELPVSGLSHLTPGSLVCVIKEKEAIVIESYVSTEDVVHLAIGGQAELVQKTREEDLIYAGTITAISEWAEEQVSVLGMMEHRVKVTVTPDQEIPSAGSGYDMDVRFLLFAGDQCIVLPNSAFYQFEGNDYVFLIQEGKLVPTPVVKGASTSTETVVSSGVVEGDLILRNATADGMKEGLQVTMLTGGIK